jgi:hypothetical protein
MLKKIILILISLFLLNACAHTLSSGTKEINYKQYNKLVKGKTTYKEAIRLLGNPNEVQESEKKTIAIWETSETTVVGLLVPFGSKVEMKRITTSLFFDRDTQVLSDYYQRISKTVNGDKMNLQVF